MRFEQALSKVDPGEYINDEFEAVFATLTEKEGPNGKYWYGLMTDPANPNFKANFISNTPIPRNYVNAAVVCKGQGWCRNEDFNGKLSIKVGKKAEFERIGELVANPDEGTLSAEKNTSAQEQPREQQPAGSLPGFEGRKPSRQQMLDKVAGITDGMSINNAVLLICAYKELYLGEIEERGLGPVLHEVSTTIIDVAIQHEHGNYAPLESVRRREKRESAAKPALEQRVTESDF